MIAGADVETPIMYTYVLNSKQQRLKTMRFNFCLMLLVVLLCGNALAQSPPASAQADKVSDWKEFSSNEGRFTVSLPGTPTADVIDAGTRFGVLKAHFFVLKTDTFLYYISYLDLPESPQTAAENKAALDEIRDQRRANARLISENDITLDGIVGREVLLDRNGQIQKGRFFYAGQRLYYVIVNAPTNVVFRDGKPSPNPKDRTDLFEQTAAKFFDSFKLKQ